MIFFVHARIENSGNMTSLLVNPPDIGLTGHPSSLSLTSDPVDRLQPDRLPKTTNEEKLP